MNVTPGYVRFRGEGKPLLVGSDVNPEVQIGDGTWLPLRGVCSLVLTVVPDGIVRATMEIDVSVVDLSGAMQCTAVWIDQRSFWQRAKALFVRKSLTT